MTDRNTRLDLEDRYENMMRAKVPNFNVSSCTKLGNPKDEYKCYIKMGMAFSKQMNQLLDLYRPKCKSITDPLEKRTCTWAINRVFGGEKYDVNQNIKLWRSYLKTLSEGNNMQSIKTILLFEAKYRHDILGLSLDEIENQLKNYPTQDAEDLLKRLRNDIGTDSINREDPSEDDVSVTEGTRDEYRERFNKMLKDAGASNISELTPEKRKQFFMKLDKSWKAKSEKMGEETEVGGDDIFSDFVEMFAEDTDILILIANEMKKLDAEALDEASKTKRTTITKISRQTKIDRAIGSLSVQYAKAVDDPMYKKFKKYKDKWMKFKERIQQKYKARVRTAARQGGGISHLLKDKQKGGAQTGKTAPKKK